MLSAVPWGPCVLAFITPNNCCKPIYSLIYADIRMPDQTTKTSVTLEDLLRLKRAERPPEQFWATFETELRSKQLAAAVEKPRWWFGLPRWFAGISRYQMPLGAAAALAVTFLVVRDYREPGLEAVTLSGSAADVPAMEGPAERVVEVESLAAYSPMESSAQDTSEVTVATTTQSRPSSSPRPVSRLPADRQSSPSARSIAANLAAVDQSGDWDRVLGDSARFVINSSTREEPLAQVASPTEVRRDRLFAYVATPAEMRSNAEDRAAPIRERMASRINEDELYERVRRMNAGGDRLTLKF